MVYAVCIYLFGCCQGIVGVYNLFVYAGCMCFICLLLTTISCMPLYRDGIFIAKLPMLPFSLQHFLGSLFSAWIYAILGLHNVFNKKNVKSYSERALDWMRKSNWCVHFVWKVNGCTLQVGWYELPTCRIDDWWSVLPVITRICCLGYWCGLHGATLNTNLYTKFVILNRRTICNEIIFVVNLVASMFFLHSSS